MRFLSPTLVGLWLLPSSAAAEDALPSGCDFGVSPKQDAPLSCNVDVDRNGDGSLSRREADRLPRTHGHDDEPDVDGAGGVSPGEFRNRLRWLLRHCGGEGVCTQRFYTPGCGRCRHNEDSAGGIPGLLFHEKAPFELDGSNGIRPDGAHLDLKFQRFSVFRIEGTEIRKHAVFVRVWRNVALWRIALTRSFSTCM